MCSCFERVAACLSARDHLCMHAALPYTTPLSDRDKLPSKLAWLLQGKCAWRQHLHALLYRAVQCHVPGTFVTWPQMPMSIFWTICSLVIGVNRTIPDRDRSSPSKSGSGGHLQGYPCVFAEAQHSWRSSFEAISEIPHNPYWKSIVMHSHAVSETGHGHVQPAGQSQHIRNGGYLCVLHPLA